MVVLDHDQDHKLTQCFITILAHEYIHDVD